MKEREIVINIENCEENMEQEGDVVLDDKVCGVPVSVVDVLSNGENSLSPSRNVKDGVGGGEVISPDLVGKTRKERRMTTSAKKPPRPPRGLSLDAADQKLIKEISELLMMKRARIERMKALKKAKAAKGMSASGSSSGNLLAMLFTLVFCIVILFQGCHPWGISPKHRSAAGVGVPISPKSDGDTVSIHKPWNLSTMSRVLTLSESGSSTLLARGTDNTAEGGRSIR